MLLSCHRIRLPSLTRPAARKTAAGNFSILKPVHEDVASCPVVQSDDPANGLCKRFLKLSPPAASRKQPGQHDGGGAEAAGAVVSGEGSAVCPTILTAITAMKPGSQASTAEVEQDLLELWSAVEHDKAAGRERALAARRTYMARLRHQVPC